MPNLDVEAERSRRRFVAWMRWWMAMNDIPSGAALGRKLGVTGAAITFLFHPHSPTAPSLRMLVAAKIVTGIPIDALLMTDPPATPRR